MVSTLELHVPGAFGDNVGDGVLDMDGGGREGEKASEDDGQELRREIRKRAEWRDFI